MTGVPRPSATDAYARNKTQAAAILEWIADELNAHAQASGAAPMDWAKVAAVSELKRHLIHALSGLSGIPEVELEEAVRTADPRASQPTPPPRPSEEQGPTVTDLLADPNRCLTPEEAAVVLRITPTTLATWRYTKRHAVPFRRVGRCIRYRAGDLADWLRHRTVTPADLDL